MRSSALCLAVLAALPVSTGVALPSLCSSIIHTGAYIDKVYQQDVESSRALSYGLVYYHLRLFEQQRTIQQCEIRP
jgi:hypothetical protein